MQVNEATGEVTVELGGKAFVLHATMPRVAAYQAALGVRNFGSIHERLLDGDVQAVHQGLRCLCVSSNEADIDLLLLSDIGPSIVALSEALTAGLPKEPARGNGDATTAEKAIRPGRDFASSPSA